MNQEQRVAKMFQGRRTRASGALPQDKGDIIKRQLKLVIQCKEVKQDKYYVTIQLLDKCIQDAIKQRMDFYGALFVTFKNSLSLYKDQFMIPEDFLTQIDQDIKNSIISKAINYTLQTIIIQPSSSIYKVQDVRGRNWFIVPALFYKWV